MNCIWSFEEVGGICKSLLLQQARDLCNFQLLNMVGLIFERGDCIISLHNSSEGAGVKVGRNGPERRSGAQQFLHFGVPAGGPSSNCVWVAFRLQGPPAGRKFVFLTLKKGPQEFFSRDGGGP